MKDPIKKLVDDLPPESRQTLKDILNQSCPSYDTLLRENKIFAEHEHDPSKPFVPVYLRGVYHLANTEKKEVEAYNISDSGGRAMSIAENYNFRYAMGKMHDDDES